MSLLSAISTEQQEAIDHDTGPLLVIAGPGAGKTLTLTSRVAALVQRGFAPERLLVTTFTRRAAQEMKDRLVPLLGEDADRVYNVGTVHSRCLRVIKMIGPERFGLRKDFEIVTESRASAMLRKIKDSVKSGDIESDLNFLERGSAAMRIKDSELHSAINLSRDMMCAPSAFFTDGACQRFADVVEREYTKELLRENVIDFALMQKLAVDALKNDPVLLTSLRRRFDHVLVDEYQDTNPVQELFFRLLAEEHRNITVVGDLDQSIYSFRGAVPSYFIDFTKQWPDTKKVWLGRNYRSCPAIVKAAASVIDNNEERLPVLHEANKADAAKIQVIATADPASEAGCVRHFVSKMIAEGHKPSEIAVLYRMRFLSAKVEKEFRVNGIPHIVIGSLPFYERREIQDLLAWMRLLLDDDNDYAFDRAVKAPPCGVGATTIGRVLSAKKAAGSNITTTCKGAERIPGIRGRQASSLSHFARLLVQLRDLIDDPDLVHEILDRSGFGEMLRAEDAEASEDGGNREANANELAEDYSKFVTDTYPKLERSCVQVSSRSDKLSAFLETLPERITEDPKSDGESEQEAVTLSTIHAAKGREFDTVLMVGCEEGIMPARGRTSDSGVFVAPQGGPEEERRIFFVGMTRARNRLFLLRAESRINFATGAVVPTTPSRYLGELDSSYVDIVRSPVGPEEGDTHVGRRRELAGFWRTR